MRDRSHRYFCQDEAGAARSRPPRQGSPRGRMSTGIPFRRAGLHLGRSSAPSLYRAPTLGRAWLREPQPAPSSWGSEAPGPRISEGTTHDLRGGVQGRAVKPRSLFQRPQPQDATPVTDAYIYDADRTGRPAAPEVQITRCRKDGRARTRSPPMSGTLIWPRDGWARSPSTIADLSCCGYAIAARNGARGPMRLETPYDLIPGWGKRRLDT